MSDIARRTLKAKPLTAAAFSRFGDVIDADAAKQSFKINQDYTTRFHDLAKIDVTDEGGDVCVSIFRSTPLEAPVIIRLMERHPLGSQAFVPLGAHPYLVVVAPPGPFAVDDVDAFLAKPGQGVNYAKGVWHHFLLAQESQSDFLVIDRAGPGDNLDEVHLAEDQQFIIGV